MANLIQRYFQNKVDQGKATANAKEEKINSNLRDVGYRDIADYNARNQGVQRESDITRLGKRVVRGFKKIVKRYIK